MWAISVVFFSLVGEIVKQKPKPEMENVAQDRHNDDCRFNFTRTNGIIDRKMCVNFGLNELLASIRIEIREWNI